MRTIFKCGRINDNEKSKIYFETNGTDVDLLFEKSLHALTNGFSFYDIITMNNDTDKPIYLLCNNHKDKDGIIKETEAILSGDCTNIVNFEDVFIHENVVSNPKYKTNNTIFWDVINDFIIIFGDEELYCFVREIESLRWREVLEMIGVHKDFETVIKEDDLSICYQKARFINNRFTRKKELK